MNTRKRKTPQERKKQILAAAELVLLEVGIENFTVDQVIEKAGIAKGTVYNHYKNKDEMLGAIGVLALGILHDRFFVEASQHENSLDKIRAICLAAYTYNQDYPQYFDLITYMERPEFEMSEQKYLQISQRLQNLMFSVVEHGKSRKEIRTSFDPMMVNYIVWSSCMGVVQFVETKKKFLSNVHEIDTQQLVDTYIEMLLHGLENKK
ncbi:MAG: TetR/AcrR family transcriptional regulator [Bacteroidota bacterium]